MNTPLNRRDFIGTGLVAGLGAALAPTLGAAPSPRAQKDAPGSAAKTMLILGGTQFLGPQLVRAAQEAGYRVTLFNRGRTNPHLFPELEKIRGDRNLEVLEGLFDRSFDIVVDTSGYVPKHVQRTAEILGPNCGRYIFVSTVSVYPEGDERVFDEGSPVTVLDQETLKSVKTIRESFPFYSGMKAHCEKAAAAAAPGKVLSIRPGLIVGPGDTSDRFTYWPARIARGGDILAPGGSRILDAVRRRA